MARTHTTCNMVQEFMNLHTQVVCCIIIYIYTYVALLKLFFFCLFVEFQLKRITLAFLFVLVQLVSILSLKMSVFRVT